MEEPEFTEQDLEIVELPEREAMGKSFIDVDIKANNVIHNLFHHLIG